MANYGYLQNVAPALTRESFLAHVEIAVSAILGPRWKVEWASWAFDGPTVLVSVPGTAECTRAYFGEPVTDEVEDVGFTISLQDEHTIAFRHGPNVQFARWAQGCVEEEMSERLQAPLYYDAGSTYEPGRREYRRGATFRAYLLRNFDGKAEDAEHEAFVQGLLRGTPPGFET